MIIPAIEAENNLWWAQNKVEVAATTHLANIMIFKQYFEKHSRVRLSTDIILVLL